MKSFFIKDNVCTPYKLILNRASNFLIANNWMSAASENEADIYIVGCCGAFHSLENEAIEMIKSAKKTNAEVVVFGCLAGISPEKIKKLRCDRVVSSKNWEDLETLVENPKVTINSIPEATRFRLKEEYRLYDPGKQFVLLQTGCSSNCPYCPHKLGIGQLKSRPADEIIRQVKNLTKNGVHTIVLHGNDTGSYGTDFGNITYPRLLENVLKYSSNIHLTQINADWVYEYRKELLPLLLNDKIKDFQVLIQTASNRLLRLMERKPVVKLLFPYIRQLREKRQDIIFRTDIIIGYPTATPEEEMETLEYVSELFDEVAVHGFELFPHTRIAGMDLPFFPQEEIDKRVQRSLEYLTSSPQLLVHRGGQVYKTLENIEKPKLDLRKKRQVSVFNNLKNKYTSLMKNTFINNGYTSLKNRYPNTETLKISQTGNSIPLDRQYEEYRKVWGKSPASENDFSSVPLQIDIDVNDMCNLKCYHCFARSVKRAGYKMNDAIICSLFEQLKKHQIYALNIGFCSEPTLEIDIVKNIFNRARTDCYIPDLFIHTNGLLLDKDAAEFFIKKKINMVCVSFNAGTRETYKKITGTDCYGTVIKNIRQLKAIRDRSGKKFPAIRVSMVVLEENYRERELFYKLWENIADKIELQKYKNYGKAKKLPLKNQSRFCPWPFMRMSIWPDGSLRVCPNIYSLKDDLALPFNINSDDIREVWNSERIQNIRKDIFNNNLISCNHCQNDCETIY